MNWIIKSRSKDELILSNTSLITQIYKNRGVEPNEDLSYPLQNLLHFKTLTDIEKVSERLYLALRKKEKIKIIGDYDTDGATSTSLMVTALKAFGFSNISFAVPDRFKYGYGLTSKLIKDLDKENIDLIITVDNGIASHEGVDYANEQKIDVIITDHHLAGDQLPNAFAIVNPNQANDSFESNYLAGVGVAFYVLLGLRDYLKKKEHQPLPNMKQYLDLVALGTIADLVPLDYNNRILVYHGLEQIRNDKTRPGIRSLLNVSKKSPGNIVASDFGFLIAPKLNAAGRLDDMTIGINCLISDDKQHAHMFANELQNLNEHRKNIDQNMQLQALKFVDNIRNLDEKNVIVLYHPEWHEGVIGIVASKIKEKYHRPTFIFAKNEQYLKASARSIPGINLKDVLTYLASTNPDLLKGYGGHAMAAGLSIDHNDYEKFSNAMNKVMTKFMKKEYLQKIFWSDGKLDESQIHMNHALSIEAGGPWGQGFEEPIFHGNFKLLQVKALSNGKHGAYTLTTKSGSKIFDGIYFNVSPDQFKGIREVLIIYQLKVNRFNHRTKLQLQILAMKPIS
ncbi:MAG: single-stranded-DNA-specific exonuclease RecJ [Gammaproteobacteria bacterium]|nr:single-stranded-DNA-specific exonuclease RecJ [Gammaproteobacteria bacterium]